MFSVKSREKRREKSREKLQKNVGKKVGKNVAEKVGKRVGKNVIQLGSLSMFSIIAIFVGIPSGILCGGKRMETRLELTLF